MLTSSTPSSLGNYRLLSAIGQGASGTVRLAIHKNSKSQVAIKIIPRPDSLDQAKKEAYIIREAYAISILNHPNINKLKACHVSTNSVFLIIDFISGVDLVDHLQRYGRMSERETRFIFRQLVSAVEYCHRNSLIHRDLKFENIRYNLTTGLITIIDFGLCAFHHQNNDDVRIRNSMLLASNCGSPCYASPEIYKGNKYLGPEVDIWSLGIILYSMAVGSLPFYGNSFNELGASILSGLITFPDHLSIKIVDLIQIILKVDYKQRAKIKDIIQHSWINMGYMTIPLDYIELRVKPDKIQKIPVMQDTDIDDNEDEFTRYHPILTRARGLFNADNLYKIQRNSVDLKSMIRHLREKRVDGDVGASSLFYCERDVNYVKRTGVREWIMDSLLSFFKKG